MATSMKGRKRPMNVYVRRGSHAEDKYRALAGVHGLEPEEIAPGVPPTPKHDLVYHGGKTIPALTFINFYVGADAWQQSDIDNIDKALATAMTDAQLNNVMAQYFNGKPPATACKPSQKLAGPAPATFSQGDVEQLVSSLFGQGKLAGFDYGSTVFNFMLPPGTVLNDNPAAGGARGAPEGEVRRRRFVPEEEEADSHHGLGGYHGSVQAGGQTLYYAVGVYSDDSGGQTNGIPVFDMPWKNVVATFYHELNEARTDADVEAVINGGAPSMLGWTSRQGEECGDFPVFEANPLTEVFQEVGVPGGGTVPIQFMYSDHAHGPEGPVANPEPAPKHTVKHSKLSG